MVDIILKVFKLGTEIWTQIKDWTFPLAEASGIPEAFPSPENPRGSDWQRAEPDWNKLREHYGGAVYINRGTPLEWREVILTIPTKKPDEILEKSDEALIYVPAYRTDSFTVQAQREGIFLNNSYLETVIHSYTKTYDESKLLIGTRGGSESAGKLIVVPGGAVGFTQCDTTIVNSVYKEANEEAGIRKSDLETASWAIGAFRQEMGCKAPSNMFVYTLRLAKGIEQRILEKHTEAMELYRKIKAESKGDSVEREYLARQRLKEEARKDGTFPADAWENERLELIVNEPEVIMRRVGAVIEEARSGKGNGLMHSMFGSLFVYFMHEFGEKYAGRLMELPGFKDNVRFKEKYKS